MRLIFAFHFVMLCLVNLQAQNIAFNINNVPKEVRAGADWVMRSENIEFEVSQIEKSKLNVQRIITVLNEKGREKLFFIQPTDKYITIEDFEARVFDSTGKELAKFKQKDLGSRSHYEGLMSDVKLYYLDIPSYTLPVTVAYKYEIGFKGSLQYPAYDILEPGEGIENSSYTVRILNDLDLRYKEKNIHLDPALNYEGRYKIYNWNVRNLAPLEYEEGAVSYESRYPSILLAPNKFKVEDFEGNMTSWNEFGKWYQMLSQGADQLPDERKKFFNDLVKDAKSDRQKAAILYKYLQDNLRYVSIQLGIGGYKPFPAMKPIKKNMVIARPSAIICSPFLSR